MVLEQYAFTFANWGTICMMPFFVCPLIVCWNIVKFGFSDFLPPNIFLDGLLRCILLYYHGKILMAPIIMQQNVFGITLHLIYVALYYHYLYNKPPFYKAILKSGTLTAIILIYLHWESPLLAPQRFGYILTLLNLSTHVYPILGIYYVFKSKTTFGMPYAVIFFGQIVTTLWLLFGISINNYWFVAQMLIPFVLGAIQIALYFVYPSVPPWCNWKPETADTVTKTTTTAAVETAVNNTNTVTKDRKMRLVELRKRKIVFPDGRNIMKPPQ